MPTVIKATLTHDKRLPALVACLIAALIITLTITLATTMAAQSAPDSNRFPVRFAAIGDYGSGDPQEGDVANRIRTWNPDFIITLGDNNYDNGSADTI